MAKKTGKKNKGKKQQMENPRGAWISMRTGLTIIAITSIGMALLTYSQASQTKGTLEAILWSLFFGGMIWVIFIGYYLLLRLLRR